MIRHRLMDFATIQGELKRLTKMLVTLGQMGVVALDPPPPPSWRQVVMPGAASLIVDVTPDDADSTESADDSDDIVEMNGPTSGRRIGRPLTLGGAELPAA